MIARIHARETVTPEMVAVVLAHPLGGRKNAPVGARLIVLINKVESDEQRTAAMEIADLLLRAPGIGGVLAGAVARGDTPIMDCLYRGESRADNE
jgi:probable selenium-dependent hydroxylase accessory protein YqeC